MHEIIYHGYCRSDYFQGCTRGSFVHVFTGCGPTPAAAYDDVLDQVYATLDDADKLHLPTTGVEAQLSNAYTELGDDVHHYVSIRCSVAPSYTAPLPDRGDLMQVDAFRTDAVLGFLTDADGYGHPVKDGWMDAEWNVYPSEDVPSDATHVLWFNR